MECALLSPLHKRGGRSIAPINPKRPALLKLRAKLAKTIRAFLTAEAPKIAAQINTIRSHALKADLTQDQQSEVDRIMAEIDLTGWALLVGDVRPVLEEIAMNGGIEALKQVHIDVTADPSVLNIVSQDALEYAGDRSAAMIGMRRNLAGDLVANPDAKWRIDASTREMVRSNVEQALADGWTNDQLATAIGDSYAFSNARAMTIARTETQLAANQGAVNGYRASGVVDGKQWLTAEDDEVSEDCVENGAAGDNGDGVIGLDETYPSGDDAPPAHPNCLPGDVLVLARDRIAATCERWYDGEVVVIRTASGKKLTCTPNHPVLTPRGWVAARLLNEGGDVISSLEWVTRIDHDGKDVPARIEDVAKALRRARDMASREVPLSAKNFHGDGVGSEVAVIWSDRLLRDGVDPALGQGGSDFDFDVADVQTARFDSERALNLFSHRMLAAASGLMRCASLFASRLVAHALPFQQFRLASAAPGNAAFAKHPFDNGARHPERLREFVLGSAGKVFADKVVAVEVNRFHGVVFNMETASGMYVANGIITHNCRCSIAPYIDWNKEQDQ